MITSCKTLSQPPQVVREVDLNRYAGKWYEIASHTGRFQAGCSCTSAEYILTNKKYIKVVNTCLRNNKMSGITGKAFPVRNSRNTKLKVQFFWPFRGDYWIVDLAPDYSWAVVSGPRRKYFWILSRSKTMEHSLYEEILSRMKSNGFDTCLLTRTSQDCGQ